MNLLFLLLFLALPLGTAFAGEKPVFLDPASVDIRFLGNPPADDSNETKADIAALLLIQENRTSGDIDRARAEIDYDPAAFFSGVLDPTWFNPKKLPLTFALLEAVKSDSKLVTAQGKTLWNRPRPPLLDKRLHPACELPKSPSYPSSHAALGITWARILSNLLPEGAPALMQRGTQAGGDRAVLGVHFPSDIAAGQKLGFELANRFLADPAFQAAMEKARAEIPASRHIPHPVP